MSKALKNKIKLNDFVSVKDFGAVGDYYLADGSINPSPTNNTPFIQAAIDAVSAGATLEFDIGRGYYLQSGLSCNKWLTLCGRGMSNSVYTSAVLVCAAGITGLSVNTETFAMNKVSLICTSSANVNSVGLNIKQIAGATIRPIYDIRFTEVWFSNFGKVAMNCPTSMYGGILDKCTFEGNAKALSINYDEVVSVDSATSFNKIVNSVFFNNAIDIEIKSSAASLGASTNFANIIANNNFINTVVTNTGTNCVVLNGSLNGTVIEGNSFANCPATAISVTGTIGTVISNNSINRSGKQGIAITNAAGFVASGNTVNFTNANFDTHAQQHSAFEIVGSTGKASCNVVAIDNPVELKNQYGFYVDSSTIDLGDISQINGVAGEYLSTNGAQVTFTKSGSFIPAVVGSATPGAQTYTAQEGRYSVSGNVVTVSILVSGTKDAAASGDLRIQGLPVLNATGRRATNTSYMLNLVPAANSLTQSTTLQLVGEKLGHVDYIRVIEYGSATFNLLPMSSLQTSFSLTVTGSYCI
jgi:hypothetical protein